MRPSPCVIVTSCFALALGCAPCRGELRSADPLAWAGPVRQCAVRRDARPTETHERRCSAAPVAKLPDRPLQREDVVYAPGPGGATLVWVQTEHFADADAAGPIALIETHAQTVKVLAIGWMRAPTKIIRMELVRNWLVVHGESCIQLLRRDRGVIHRLAIEEFGADCLAPARFVFREEGQRAIDEYVRREFVIERRVYVVGRVPMLAEYLVVRDLDPRLGAVPETIVVSQARERPLQLDDDEWVLRVAEEGLWSEVMEDEIDLFPDTTEIRLRGSN